MTWTHPDDSPKIKIPIDGDYFQPNTKYTVKIIPKGEIEGIVAPETAAHAPSRPEARVHWLDLGHGVWVQVRPCTTALVMAARAARNRCASGKTPCVRTTCSSE